MPDRLEFEIDHVSLPTEARRFAVIGHGTAVRLPQPITSSLHRPARFGSTYLEEARS